MKKQWNERGFHLFWVIEEEGEEGATKGKGNRLGKLFRGLLCFFFFFFFVPFFFVDGL